ncbi:MAG: hypothetical protein H6814_05595 [Phycisphaeraceae bacterium]|nr:hypothetical protein [Phycisphaeraceae bacterium]
MLRPWRQSGALSALCGSASLLMFSGATGAGTAPAPVDTGNPILFVTQVPVPDDFANIGSPFANHMGEIDSVARGGDLWIRYPDGSMRNLTEEAGYGQSGFQSLSSIAVRQPCVHWDGRRAVFSMVVGATPTRYEHLRYVWQLYEVTGLGRGETAVITKVPGQPDNYNNVSPIYASDGDIIFTSDRPRDGSAHLHPQLDEYESTETNTGLWSLDSETGELRLLAHEPSGAFDPFIESTSGRLLYTKWDHLQRDQQADAQAMGGYAYGAFNATSEAPAAPSAGHFDEVFPEPRAGWLDYVRNNQNYSGPLRGYRDNLVGHSIEFFQLWQLNQDGTAEESLNHAGRHELKSYFTPSFNDDPNLVEFFGAQHAVDRPMSNFLQGAEDPNNPGVYYGIDAPTFFTHSCGQIVRINGGASVNPDDMRIEYVTNRETANYDYSPAPEHSGLYRNPLPLTNGVLLAVHTPETRPDENDGTRTEPTTRYDLRIKRIDTSGGDAVAAEPLTDGIYESVRWWDPDELVRYNGPLWELDPVEVVARPAPAPSAEATLEAPERAAFLNAGASEAELRAYLKANGLALIVSRNVTTRDHADRQQPYNLRIDGSDTQSVADDGRVYDVSSMQILQGDLIRGYESKQGRRVLAQPMHDAPGLNHPVQGAPGAVRLGGDGSMAAIVPAQRALSWQLLDPAHEPVVRERYWLSFQPGEIRVCTSCHGVNRMDQTLAPPPTNTPQALTSLLDYLQREDIIGESLPGDLNGDGLVDTADLGILIAQFGGPGTADLDGDGVVSTADLALLIASFNAGR